MPIYGPNELSRLQDYAGIYVDENAVVTTINVVDAFEKITVFATNMANRISTSDQANDLITIGATALYDVIIGNISASSAALNKVYEFFAFEIAASGDAITGATQANPCVVTATGHSFSDGDRVKITGVAGMTELNNRIFTVANKGANTFELNDDNGGNINSGGFGAYTTGGIAFLATRLNDVHSHRKFGGIGDIGAMAASGLVSLTSGNTVEVWVKGVTDASNLTVESISFYIKRID